MKKNFYMTAFCLVFVLSGGMAVSLSADNSTETGLADPVSKNGRSLSIEEFIVLAARNDKEFEAILIDELKLKYQKNLNLPAGDIVLSVKSKYNLLLSHDSREQDLTVSLSKLFPYTGTTVSASYGNAASLSTGAMGSDLSVLISQPIAQNAFGHATRLQDKIVGLEIDVAQHQIIEAYEDYLSALMAMYYNWYSAYENLQISRASYKQNQMLLDNMLERARQKIALPVDVNKVKLLVIRKEENVIESTENCRNLTHLIEKAIRYEGEEPLAPENPFGHHQFEIDFQTDYQEFAETSRTYEILRLLENRSGLEVEKEANDLLPSTDLLIGYDVSGSKWRIQDEDNLFYIGISAEWPFGHQVDRAEYETKQIDYQKRRLISANQYLKLYVELKNIYLEIQKEEQYIRLADDKIRLAAQILEKESENYSFGKISLNDYIDAVNKLDEEKFNKIDHSVKLHKLLTEWLRLTDRLVDRRLMNGEDAGKNRID